MSPRMSRACLAVLPLAVRARRTGTRTAPSLPAYDSCRTPASVRLPYAVRRPPAALPRPRHAGRGRFALFESPAHGPRSPQEIAGSGVHTLGTGELSRNPPQARPLREDLGRSDGWGFVGEDFPQAVDGSVVHRRPKMLSTGRPQQTWGCPQLLHSPVHCSATRHGFSSVRVNQVTGTPPDALWGSPRNLWVGLWASHPELCTACAELSGVHRNRCPSTGPPTGRGGQNLEADQGKESYPRFPQALLLRPPRVSPGNESKWVLCTTRPRAVVPTRHRLDPHGSRLSVRCVRLDPGKRPAARAGGG